LPEEYKNYTDIFSKQKAKLLLDHWPYDLTIYLEEGKTSPLDPIYSLSPLELQTLHEFLDKNLKTRTICTSVLFVKKKNRSLCLYVDYQRLNKLIWKDRYLIPLLADLLDAPKKA